MNTNFSKVREIRNPNCQLHSNIKTINGRHVLTWEYYTLASEAMERRWQLERKFETMLGTRYSSFYCGIVNWHLVDDFERITDCPFKQKKIKTAFFKHLKLLYNSFNILYWCSAKAWKMQPAVISFSQLEMKSLKLIFNFVYFLVFHLLVLCMHFLMSGLLGMCV